MKKLLLIVPVVLLTLTLSGFMSVKTVVKFLLSDKSEVAMRPENTPAPTKSLYDFTVKTIDGKPVALKQFQGKKVIVLNTASKCGFTPQFEDWEAFYKKHGDKIIVLGFPSNDFKGQDPGSNEEIAEFCKKNYGVTFPMFEKIDVIGDNQAPIYKWLSDKSMNGWNDKVPTWNFCKYVINEKGELTHFFASKVKPEDDEFKKAVGL